MRSLLLALHFLTAIPVRLRGEIALRALARSTAWFSLVGLMLGAILGLADAGLRALLPPLPSAALLVLLWLALTGALHFDGFLDCCDGLLGARSVEKRLEIMRDSHLGAFAVGGGVCLLLLKFAVLAEVPEQQRMAALFVIPALTRAMVVYAMRAYRYARPDAGLGSQFREGLTWREPVIAGIVAVAAAALALGAVGLALALWVWLVGTAIAWLVQRRIHGLTGDVYGAINETAEVGALLLLVGLGGRW